MFGYPIETPRTRYWGARAIFQRDYIDLVPNRQIFDGVEDKAFDTWLNKRAIPWLRAEVTKTGLSNTETKELVLHEFIYELRANPQNSHGYLYIGAVEHTVIECGTVQNSVTKYDERLVQVGNLKFVVDQGHVVVGTHGTVTMNGIGPGTVVGYYNEVYGNHKLACLRVALEQPPDWWLKQSEMNAAEKEVKEGRIPKMRHSPYNDPDEKSAQYKSWKANYQPEPCIVWADSFVSDGAA